MPREMTFTPFPVKSNSGPEPGQDPLRLRPVYSLPLVASRHQAHDPARCDIVSKQRSVVPMRKNNRNGLTQSEPQDRPWHLTCEGYRQGYLPNCVLFLLLAFSSLPCILLDRALLIHVIR